MSHSLVVRLHPEGFPRVRRRTIAIFAAVFVAIAGFMLFGVSDKIDKMWWAAPLTLFILAIGIGSAYFKLSRRQKREWESYRLDIDDDRIVREVHNYPTVSIRRSDITAIEERPSGAIVVKTKEKDWFIYIPPEIERRDEVLSLLSLTVPPLVPSTTPFSVRYHIPLQIGWIGALIAFFVSHSPFVEIPLGLLILGWLIFFYIYTQKHRMLSKDVKLKLWMVIFFTVMIVFRILVSLGFLTSNAQ